AKWPLASQDRCIRVLSAAGAPERASVLLALLGSIHPFVQSLALDEMSMSRDASVIPRLLQFAQSTGDASGGEFLQLKAVEALGRLRAREASELLQRLIQQKNSWRRSLPDELRVAALQSLAKIDPAAAESLLPRAALDAWQVSFPALDAISDAQWYR